MSDLARIDAFVQLRDALTRMHALDVQIKTFTETESAADLGFEAVEEFDRQIDRALEAWAVLVSSGLADELSDYLNTRFGGRA